MFKKILVAVDMSDKGEEVFKVAVSLAQMHNASLTLLHVLSAEEEGSPLPVPPDLKEIYPAKGNDLTLEQWRQEWVQFEQEGLDRLTSYCQQASNLGIETDYKQIYGSPARTICKIAQQIESNLIVIGRRGRNALQEMLLGSVSNYVLHHATCSVLIVQQ